MRRASHIAALFANTNFDSDDNNRNDAVDSLERFYDDQIARIWNADGKPSEAEQEEESAWESAFMRAGRNRLAAQMQDIKPPSLPGAQAIADLPSLEIDQG